MLISLFDKSKLFNKFKLKNSEGKFLILLLFKYNSFKFLRF